MIMTEAMIARMDEEARVRDNRLALLGRINDTFTRIADFRQLAV